MTKYIAPLLALLVSIFFWACDREEFTTDRSHKLDFSVDTLRFDTVFTELGSATRLIKVYNRHSKWLRIDEIELENAQGGNFRLNIDGVPTSRTTNIEIAPNDSLYIFAEVTINPDAPVSVSPFIIQAPILFSTNGNTQRVVLEAWGQNANYLPSRFGAGGGVVLSCNMGELDWNDPKPYVISGVLLIDSCQVNIPAGTRIYVHGGVQKADNGDFYNDGIIYIGENGRINIRGTAEKPVTMASDRLEKEFAEVAGQWSRLHLLPNSRGNYIEHLHSRNAINAIVIDSAAQLVLKNSIITDAADVGVVAVRSEVTAENCLIYDCLGGALQLIWGGNYDFTYCTFANYTNGTISSLYASNALCLDQNCGNFLSNDLHTRFTNCIVAGSKSDQIALRNRTENHAFDYEFDHCVVRVNDLTKPDEFPDFFDHCNGCVKLGLSDKLFKDINKRNYTLDSLSVANGKALPLPNTNKDLRGTLRNSVTPDIGALERVE